MKKLWTRTVRSLAQGHEQLGNDLGPDAGRQKMRKGQREENERKRQRDSK